MFRSVLAAAVCAVLLPASTSFAVSFADGVFDPVDWSVVVTGAGTANHVQELTGGNPDEYIKITNRPTASSGSTVLGFHLHSGFVYDPSVSGAIGSIEWSLDVMNVALGHLVGLAISQGGSLSGPGSFVTSPFGIGGWVGTGPTVLTPGDLPAGLDLSATGDPLTFGIFAANTFDPAAGDTDNIVGYDNLSVTVNPVPEPGSLVVLGLALVSVRRRVR